MSQAKRDQNRVTTGMGVNNTDRTTPLLLKVEPSTNRLLVSITEQTDQPGIITKNEVDQNRVWASYGINNSDRTTPMPFNIDPNTGYLGVNIIAT